MFYKYPFHKLDSAEKLQAFSSQKEALGIWASLVLKNATTYLENGIFTTQCIPTVTCIAQMVSLIQVLNGLKAAEVF